MPSKPSLEPILPNKLRSFLAADREPIYLLILFKYCRPVSLEGLLDIKAKHNAAKLVVGNTEVGIELKFKHAGYPVLVGTTHVPEMNTIEVRRSAGASQVFQQ